MKQLICFLILFFSCTIIFAQEKKDAEKKAISISALNIGIELQKPLLDLDERYGGFSVLNVGVNSKTIQNIVYNFSYNFILGNKVLQDDLGYLFLNSDSIITGLNGQRAVVGVFQRGYKINFGVGKIVKQIKNKNSGILVELNTGIISNRISYKDGTENFSFLSDAYMRGFDKLSRGFYLEEFVGILFFDNKKLINFKFGLNFVQGFTSDKRANFYASDFEPIQNRKDFSIGLKANWIIPFFYSKEKSTERYYYN